MAVMVAVVCMNVSITNEKEYSTQIFDELWEYDEEWEQRQSFIGILV